MAIEINNNTVVRMIVRRGPDSDRQQSTLAQGELGYTTDTQRLFIGNGQLGTETVAGNKFLGFSSSINNTVGFLGDTIYDTTAGALNVWSTSGTWTSIAPSIASSPVATIEYAGGGLRVASTFAGKGFSINYSGTGKLEYDSNLATVYSYPTGLSGIYIGSSPANTFTDSILNTQGPISVLGVGTNRIQLSANSNNSTITLGGSGLILAGNTLSLNANLLGTNGTKSFVIKDGLASGTYAQLSASPAFEFTGGLVKINSSLMVTGSANFGTVVISNTTNVSAVTSFVINTTDSSTAPLTSLLVKDDNAITGQVLLDVRGTTSGGTSKSILNARIPDGGPYLGIHTTTKYGTESTAISGGVYFKGGPVSIVGSSGTNVLTITGNATIQGDLSATGDIIGFYTSDKRLKDNITPIQNALNKTLALNGVNFTWNNSASYSGNDIGLIAQDVQQQIPEAVGTRYDGYLGVHYEKVIPLLVEAIRVLNNKVEELSKNK